MRDTLGSDRTACCGVASGRKPAGIGRMLLQTALLRL